MAEIGKGIPQVGMRFRDVEEAWAFWDVVRGHTGFDVRRRYANKSRLDGQVGSCRFVCSNEGHRRKGQTDHVPKHFIRAETRTNCQVHMCFQLDRQAGNYEVTEVVLEHNHLLQLPETRHLMISQKKISERQAFEIETADDSGIMPQAAHEFASRQVSGPISLGYTCRDQKNHLRTKRQRDLAYGQAGSMLKYLRTNALDCLWPQLEDKLNASATSPTNGCSNDHENVDPNVKQANDLLSSARPKKKKVSSKNLRRKTNWFDKLRKVRKPKPPAATKKRSKGTTAKEKG